MMRNTSVMRSGSVAIGAIVMMQGNLATRPRACASRVSVAAELAAKNAARPGRAQ